MGDKSVHSAAAAILPDKAVATPAPDLPAGKRLNVLDGWRAASILLVIAGHWLPLGPKWMRLNETAAAGGMAIFFTLSGFLITRFLLDRPEWVPFLIRRLLRIVPLAWLAMLILYVTSPSNTASMLAANLAFYSNLPPARLFPGGDHLWSLCVEMHFYAGIALVVALLRRRGLFVLPLLATAVTVARVLTGEIISIISWFRIDEILAGATIALIYSGALGERASRLLSCCNIYACIALAALCTFSFDNPIGYARPYAVALMVGATLWHVPQWLRIPLESRIAAYIAAISYALYVFHGMLGHTWLGSGDTLTKYAKRPLLIAATWAFAHVSTYYFEQRFIDLGRRLTKRRG